MDMVVEAQRRGFLIGSCSDRTVNGQRRLWEEHGITVDFTVLKHQLDGLVTQFRAREYIHVGDTDLDRRVAEQAGFRFVPADEAPGLLQRPSAGA